MTTIRGIYQASKRDEMGPSMKLILLKSLILTFFFSSCLLKKDAEKEISDQENLLEHVAQGFFTINQELYYSTGKDAYCGFRDWQHAEEFREQIPFPMLPIQDIDHHPQKMVLVPHCTNDLIE